MRPRSRPSRALAAGPVASILLALAAAGCGGDAGGGAGDGADAPLDPGPARGTGGPAEAAPEIPADAPLVAFLGDSLAAGLHLPKDLAFPAVLQRRLAAKGRPFRLVNAGVSGDTTTGGLGRVDWLLRQRPAVVVIELGANDGFRAVPVETIRGNLSRIVARVKEAGAKPLLLGMRMPPNYGLDYAAAFAKAYEEVAEEHDIPLVEFLLRGVAARPDRNLDDGIHPNREGHEILASNCEDALERLLR